MTHPIILPFLILVILFGCKKHNGELYDFELSIWKRDRYGCAGERKQFLAAIESQQDKLLKRSQHEVIALLGNPDEHELYQRTRKFFYYYFEPSYKCDSTLKTDPPILQVRFNALGISNEVFLKNN